MPELSDLTAHDDGGGVVSLSFDRKVLVQYRAVEELRLVVSFVDASIADHMKHGPGWFTCEQALAEFVLRGLEA